MKKNAKLAAIAMVVAVAGYVTYLNADSDINLDITLSDVEALAACESIGSGNNGNCVTNGSSYFCKNDTWYEFTNCLL